jgi:hypothetical protein
MATEGKSLDLLYLHVPYSLSPFASLIFTQLLYVIFTLLMHILLFYSTIVLFHSTNVHVLLPVAVARGLTHFY